MWRKITDKIHLEKRNQMYYGGNKPLGLSVVWEMHYEFKHEIRDEDRFLLLYFPKMCILH